MLRSSGKDTAVAGQVAGHACLRVDLAVLAELRRDPGILPGSKLSLGLLKHAEQQTVLAVAVTLKAIARMDCGPERFADWGVIAAPTMFGRDATALALERFRAEGAWGISPHMIPHYSLHAISGTLSQVLHTHGPNFGVSGGPHSFAEAFLVAATLLAADRLPGFWLVLTGYDREKFPSEPNPEMAPLHGEAVALALTKEFSNLELRLAPEGQVESFLEELTLASFRSELDREECRSTRWRLPGMGWVELNGS